MPEEHCEVRVGLTPQWCDELGLCSNPTSHAFDPLDLLGSVHAAVLHKVDELIHTTTGRLFQEHVVFRESGIFMEVDFGLGQAAVSQGEAVAWVPLGRAEVLERLESVPMHLELDESFERATARSVDPGPILSLAANFTGLLTVSTLFFEATTTVRAAGTAGGNLEFEAFATDFLIEQPSRNNRIAVKPGALNAMMDIIFLQEQTAVEMSVEDCSLLGFDICALVLPLLQPLIDREVHRLVEQTSAEALEDTRNTLNDRIEQHSYYEAEAWQIRAACTFNFGCNDVTLADFLRGTQRWVYALIAYVVLLPAYCVFCLCSAFVGAGNGAKRNPRAVEPCYQSDLRIAGGVAETPSTLTVVSA